MTKADEIRLLAGEGLAVADIARRLGIRYQQAYGVLSRSGFVSSQNKAPVTISPPSKPELTVDILTSAGFVPAGRWLLSGDETVTLERPLPKDVGVYAFAQGDIVKYVGVATMGLAKRIYFYGRPGITQKRVSVSTRYLVKNSDRSATCIFIWRLRRILNGMVCRSTEQQVWN